MNFLDRNTLPRFQERLDLAASELNDMEDIYVQAINELAGRIYNIANLVSQEERSQYAEETNYLILDTIQSLTNKIVTLESRIESLEGHYDSEIKEINTKYLDLEARLNALDDAAARKEDLNVLLWRSGRE